MTFAGVWHKMCKCSRACNSVTGFVHCDALHVPKVCLCKAAAPV